MPKGVSIKYTEEMLDFLSNNRTLKRKEATRLFNEKFNTSLSVKNIHAVCKRKGFYTGRTGCFEKGETPWNKDKKGYMGANKTSFKKGSAPHNHKQVGSERVQKDGYVYVKTAEPKKWELKHQFLYKKHIGEIPEGKCVRFRDGDHTNFNLDNLVLVGRFELLYLNKTKHNDLPDELKESNELIAKIESKIRE